MNVKATVYLSERESKIKGSASITIENCFVVKGIRIIEGSNGLFTAMPNKQTPTGEYKDICFPITAEARTIINDAILEAYYNKLGENVMPSNDYIPPMNDSELPF